LVLGQLGVVALRDIPRRSHLGDYRGDRMLACELRGTSRKYMMRVVNGPHLDDVYIVGTAWSAYINHAPHHLANCAFEQNDQSVEIWTIADVPRGTELLADYGYTEAHWISQGRNASVS
jgi:hypothetical protein